MPYATKQDLIDRFGEAELLLLTDRTAAGVVDDEVLGLALADAEAEIDAFLGGRYQLPLVEVPPVLARVAADLTRYRLFAGNPTETVKQRYQDAVRFLRDLASGEAVLPGQSGVTQATAGGPEFSAPDRVFTADSLEDF